MPDSTVAPFPDAAIVSCDIVGHSLADLPRQISRIAAINDIVAKVISSCGPDEVVWASGGDGGHVVFRQAAWREPAVGLITRLRDWSAGADVPLRVTAHVGPVTDVRGADGRIQVVGDGINFAGWLVTRGSAEGVVASEAFCAATRLAAPGPQDHFHDSRVLLDKGGVRHRLWLMSIGPARARWASPIESGKEELARALARGDGWEVLYYAKRILQTNTLDAQAAQAIRRLGPLQLVDRAGGRSGPEPNPFLGLLESAQLFQIVQLGELVERHYNEVICRYDDEGDTMFVILRGEVGVSKAEGKESEDEAQPSFTPGEGEIIGELAFALGGKRTADLIALSEVALLSFNHDDITRTLPAGSRGRQIRQQVDRFIARRVLEHVSHGAPYLLGSERDGPLAAGGLPWDDTIKSLVDQDDTLLIDIPRGQLSIRFADIRPAESQSEGRGLYILTTGRLRGGVDGEKTVDSGSFPLLWADLPGILVLPRPGYDVLAEPVKILYIGAAELARLELPKQTALYAALRRAAAGCYYFDAFISYNSSDTETAQRWAAELRARGLRIFLDTPSTGREFPPRLRAALLDSRAVVALVSPSVMVRDRDENWVLREAQFHREYFSGNPRIIPVCLAGGRHEDLLTGFAPIYAGSDEKTAIDQTATALTRLRDGDEDSPYSLSDHDDLTLG